MAEEQMTQEQALAAQKANCIFCKIIAGEIPARKVYEDELLVCILDIFPAAKGHLLMMTKEHYPFLPLVPIQSQVHMFKITKAMAKAMKSAVVAGRDTIFIANGAVAGQQSPHFLFHIVPRENNDGLDNFNVPAKEAAPDALQNLVPPLKQRLGAILASAGLVKQAPPSPPNPPSSLAAGVQGQVAQGRPGQIRPQSPQELQGVPGSQGIQQGSQGKPDLATFIYSNPQLKELIIKNPEGFKELLSKNPQLQTLFAGVDINRLSLALGKVGAQEPDE